jgi:GNAT superfamily N-acetyltransferase
MELTFQQFDVERQIEQHRVLFAECFPEVYDGDPEYVLNYEKTFLRHYHDFPAEKTFYQYAAMLGDQMVGFYGVLPYNYLINGKLIRSGMVGGVMTSPGHRKMGIFVKLGNFASEHQRLSGAGFNNTFPIRKEVMPGFIKMGWDMIFELPLYIKFIKLNALLKSKKLFFLASIFNPIIKIYNSLLKGKDAEDIQVRIFKDTEDITGYDDFLNKYNELVPNTLLKDKKFIKWRYGSPEKDYLFFGAYQKESLVGFVSVSSIVREQVPSYGILDFMVIDKKCLSNLHNAILDQAKLNNKEAIMMMMSRSSSKKYLLAKNGYLKSPFKFNLIIKNLNKQLNTEQLSREENWHLMFVDSDDL